MSQDRAADMSRFRLACDRQWGDMTLPEWLDDGKAFISRKFPMTTRRNRSARPGRA